MVRRAEIKDMPMVHALIKELAGFENEPDAVEITSKDLEKDGFDDNQQFVCFVVEQNGKIEGMALVYHRYSTWKGRVLHLEDLIVSRDARGKGLGTALLDKVVQFGKQQGVKRISWEVLDWNLPAIEFYEKKGANVMRDWHVVQLNEQSINNYLESI